MRTPSVLIPSVPALAALAVIGSVHSPLLLQAHAQARPRVHWVRTIGGPAHGPDGGLHIAVDGAGLVYAAGESYAPATGQGIIAACYGRDGTLLWRGAYDSPLYGSDTPGGIVPDGEGGLYVCGFASVLDGKFVLLIRFDAGGAVAWARRVPVVVEHGTAFTPRLARGADGGLVVSAAAEGRMLTLKFDASGTLLWTRPHEPVPGFASVADDVAVDGAGNVYVAGRSLQNGYAAVSYDAAGGLRWTHLEPGAIGSTLGPAMVRVGPDGNPVVAGTPESTCGLHHVGVWKLAAADGAALWTRFAPEAPCDTIAANAMAIGPDGSVFVTGGGRVGNGGFDYLTLGYGADGELLWVRSLDGPGGSSDQPTAAAVDAAGNVYVSGSGSAGPNVYDLMTASYDPEGNLRWAVTQDFAGSNERAGAIAAGPGGAVHIVGTFHVPGEANEMAVVRFTQVHAERGPAQRR